MRAIIKLDLILYYGLCAVILYGLSIHDIIGNGFQGNILLLIAKGLIYLLSDTIVYWWFLFLLVPLFLTGLHLTLFVLVQKAFKDHMLVSLIISSVFFTSLLGFYMIKIEISYWYLIILGISIFEFFKIVKLNFSSR